jgi:hypothetical protein
VTPRKALDPRKSPADQAVPDENGIRLMETCKKLTAESAEQRREKKLVAPIVAGSAHIPRELELSNDKP